MNSIDLVKMGCSNLFRRKLRTFLTTLGIVIGTISIVVMVSLGIGMKESYRQSIESMGNLDVIEVRPSYDNMNTRSYSRQQDNQLKDEDIEKIATINGIAAVTPYMEMYVTMKSGRYTANLSIIGIKPEYMDEFGYKASKGRILNGNDTIGVVFGSEVPYQFINPKKSNTRMYGGYGGFYGGQQEEREDPDVNVLEDRITLEFEPEYDRTGRQQPKPVRPEKIEGVGILEESNDWQSRSSAFMSIDTLKELKKKFDKRSGNHKNQEFGYDQVKVKVQNIDDAVEIQDKIKAMGYEAYSNMQWIEESNKMTNIIQWIFGGIGAVSLLVAAIGITNTMVMAIYERRKEIGVMKVVGASLKDIKRLFLFEAAMIGFMGGILGLIFSLLASKGLNVLASGQFGGRMGPDTVISMVPVWLAASAVGFTTLIGLLSGYLPARKAMKLSALEAIKTE